MNFILVPVAQHTLLITQWAAIKKKEADEAKIDKGAVGITKFKSR